MDTPFEEVVHVCVHTGQVLPRLDFGRLKKILKEKEERVSMIRTRVIIKPNEEFVVGTVEIEYIKVLSLLS